MWILDVQFFLALWIFYSIPESYESLSLMNMAINQCHEMYHYHYLHSFQVQVLELLHNQIYILCLLTFSNLHL